MDFRNMTGAILASLIASSAFLAVGGIWGWVKGDTAGQLIGTFFVVGLAVVATSYVANSFFKK
jgi:hypothetical protein